MREIKLKYVKKNHSEDPPSPGFYTVFKKDGSTTLKFRQNNNPNFFDGEGTSIFYLNGRDTYSDFDSCGMFIEGKTIVWKKFSEEFRKEIIACVEKIRQDPDQHREDFAHLTDRCACCGKRLTVPVSRYRGIGEECATNILTGRLGERD